MSKVKSLRNQTDSGKFVISLDFELFWGMHDLDIAEAYKDNIYGAHLAIPEMLKLFNQYDIEATWAVVGMMNFENMEALKANMPKELPNYEISKLSPYHLLSIQDYDNKDSKLFFAPELIELIEETPGQEIGSHTFSHYYVLEKGQSVSEFKADTKKFAEIMKKKNRRIESIVFPRNQISESYLSVCHELGYLTYRGNEKGWIYQIKDNDRKNYIKRGLRLIDMYVNLFGYQTYSPSSINDNSLFNIKGSRQLKPVSTSLKLLERRRLKRILNSMTYAAKKAEIYHLWWHPHNFGAQLQENLAFLKEILEHYHYLEKRYNFQSINMKNLAYEQRDDIILEKTSDKER